jgi:hypothetical protein
MQTAIALLVGPLQNIIFRVFIYISKFKIIIIIIIIITIIPETNPAVQQLAIPLPILGIAG